MVAESAGLNLDYQKLRANPPNFIRILEDADGDGVFDKARSTPAGGSA